MYRDVCRVHGRNRTRPRQRTLFLQRNKLGRDWMPSVLFNGKRERRSPRP